MQKYLVDTHVLLWFQSASNLLSVRAIELISSPANTIYFSRISLFEMAIKQKLGKLPGTFVTPLDVYNQAIKDSFSELPLENSHISFYEKVPLFQEHRDPFDRVLIAQAMFEKVPVITIDPKFRLYSDLVQVIW